jgi:hypothetical protein
MMLRQLSLTASALALFAMGCSDAPARPAKVGLYMLVRNPDSSIPEVSGRSCGASSGVEWDIGRAVKTGGLVTDVLSPTSTDFGKTLEDGKNGARIACTVRKSGVFDSDGGGTDPQITPPNGLINFRFSGAAKKNGTPATNNVTASLYTPMTFDMAANPGFPPCVVTAVHEQAPGALWMDFDCPALTKVGDPTHACHASGTVVLEYCKTGEEED